MRQTFLHLTRVGCSHKIKMLFKKETQTLNSLAQAQEKRSDCMLTLALNFLAVPLLNHQQKKVT